jgi:uncharacterized protein (DUF58 family)
MKLTTISVSAGFILIVATLLNIGQLYLMAGMLAAIPLVCFWVGRRQRGGLRARRTLQEVATEGETVTATLELENLDRWPKPHLLAADRLPDWVVREDAGSAAPASLEAASTTTFTYTLRPEKRGEYVIGPLEVTAADPLGIFQFKTELPVTSPLVVYPSPVPLPRFFLPGGSPFGASPLHSAEMRGEGSEFYGIREYQPGDPLRRVHWRSSARMGRLAVVEYEHDVSVDVTLLLDTQRGSEVGKGKETTLEYAVKIAASIAHLAASNNDMMRLIAPGYSPWREPALRGAEALHAAMDALARVRADQPTSMVDTLTSHASVFRRDAFLVCITSVWSDELVTAIASLTGRGTRVAAIFVDPATFGERASSAAAAGDDRSSRPADAAGAASPPLSREKSSARYREHLTAAGAHATVIRRGLPLAEQFLG